METILHQFVFETIHLYSVSLIDPSSQKHSFNQKFAFNCWECFLLKACFHSGPQVQHGMGPLINMQKSVFLPLWDDYELYGRKILHIESFSAIESENLVRISKFFLWKEYACAASENDKLKSATFCS